MEATLTATVSVTDQQLKDILCTAFEGGSNYWIKDSICLSKSKRNPQTEYWHEGPVYNDPITVTAFEDESKGKYVLNREALQKGLQIMATKYARHFSDFVNDNHDAITADVFLQCCLFGQIIYG